MLEIENLKLSLSKVLSDIAPARNLLRQKENLTHLSKVFDEIKQRYKNAGSPPKDLAIKAVKKFITDDPDLDDVDIDLISFAISQPINGDISNSLFNNEKKYQQLIKIYSDRCISGEDMLITWRGVLGAYFDLNPANSPNRQQFERSLEMTRLFLINSWSQVKKSSDLKLSWMSAIDENLDLLSADPCGKYAKYWLEGHDDIVLKISANLQIPSSSWFWERLFITCVQSIVNLDDINFKKSIPKALDLLDNHKIFRDKALSAVLDRYAYCSDTSVNKVLKEYVIDLWGSPEGHELAGSKWKLVSKSALDLMLNWVHETNLRLFFELLKDRGYADDERLTFWLKYVPQVKASRLVLGPTSQRIVQSRSDWKKVFNNEHNAYSLLRDDQNQDNDAFLMTIGDCLIVDFSINGGCYVYKNGQNNFSIHDKYHYSSTSRRGLKEKYRTHGMDFAHTPGWTDSHRAPYKLRHEYGIYPSGVGRALQPSSKRSVNVGDYFGSENTVTSVEKYSSIDIPKFTQKPLDNLNSNSKSSSEDSARLFPFFTAKKSGQELALKNGIEYQDQGIRFIIKYQRDKGPIAEELARYGYQFSQGIGWILV